MRRAIFALTTVLVIIFLIQPLSQMVVVEANPWSVYTFSKPHVFIESPDAIPWVIYQTTSIPIEVQVLPAPKTSLVELSYILDGSPNVKLSITKYETSLTCTGKGTLSNLTDGYHKVTVVSVDSKGNVLSDSATFLVNTTLIFPTLLLSPNNITYYSKEIPLTYTVNDPKYSVSYQLDNLKQIHLTGNTTLGGLSEGQHTIIAGATDLKTGTGLYSKQIANFTIDTINPTPTPTVPEFSWLVILPLFLSILFIVVVFRRRKLSDDYD